MNDVMKIFEHEKFGKVRTLIVKGQPWFVAKDIAEILGYTETAKAVRTHVDSEDKGVSKMELLTNRCFQEQISTSKA